MARRSPLRLTVDVGVALCVIACAVIAFAAARDAPPPLPAGVCADATGAPDYARLHAHLHVTAVLGDLEPGARATDPSRVTARALADALAADVTIAGPFARDDRAGIERALAAALADPATDVVYYNGHEYDGSLALAAPADGYRIAVLDTCWSTQRYAPRLAGSEHVAVVSNTERAVTGSVDSFLQLVAGLRARRSWDALLAPMNELATARARIRRPLAAKYGRAEHYRRDVSCR